MKKSLKRVLTFLFAVTMMICLIACGSSTTQTENETSADVSGNFVMGTGGVSGTWYPIGGAICDAMSDGDLNVTVQSSGGGVENARTLLSGERDLGCVGGDIGYYAYTSAGDFEGEDGSKLRVLFRFGPMQTQLIARANSDINSFVDVKNHACGVGAVGSGDEVAFRGFLGLFGMSYDDVNESLISVAEQATAFKDRRIDTMYLTASAPNSAILDVASQADIKIVPIAGSERDTIIEAMPFFYATTITKDAYSFLPEDVETLGLDTLMMCTSDMSDEVAYAILENMFNNLDTVQQVHQSMADFDMDFACNGGDFAVPMHDGAVKFFTEKGLM